MQPFEKMPFNDEVVKTLEKLLERAKEGRMNWLGFAICEGPVYGEDGFIGELSTFYAGHYGLQRCAKRVMARLDELQVPVATTDAKADKYCYDVGVEPISHDFIAWLVNIKMMQAREGVPGLTRVCFIRNPAVEYSLDKEHRESFFQTVMVPALQLFNCVRDPLAKEGRRQTNYSYREIVEAHKRGEKVPRIKVPSVLMTDMKANLAGVEPVVITLREHHLWPHRNSGMADWLRFAEYLKAQGEHVIFVRDFGKADEDIDGFETMPAASKDFAIRAALYEHAKCNFFVSNGPASLALFGSRPWIQFIHCHEGESDKYIPNTPRWWRNCHGIEPGEQFPWCGPDQRIVWAPDTYDAMVEAWESIKVEKCDAA